MIKTRFGGEQNKIYYDIDIFNNTESNVEVDFPLSFTETRPVQFIEKCSDYYLSVVRFNLGLSNLPVFIPKIESDQPNINKTIYKLLTSVDGIAYTVHDIIWQTQEYNVQIPQSPVVSQEFSKYYYCYDYDHFLKLLNQTLSSAYGGPDKAYFQMNPDTNNIELLTTADFYPPGGAFSIGMNDPLKNLLSTFSYKKITSALAPPTYKGDYFWKLEVPLQPIPSGVPTFYKVSTFTCPLALWNPVNSIVFTSSVIPVVPNAVAPEKFFNSNRILPSQQNANNTLNVITDFQVDVGPNNFYRPNIAYLPTAEYRLISLFGDSGLNQVQINISWKDNFGGLHLIQLGNNCLGTIKLLFEKKNS